MADDKTKEQKALLTCPMSLSQDIAEPGVGSKPLLTFPAWLGTLIQLEGQKRQKAMPLCPVRIASEETSLTFKERDMVLPAG